VFVNAEKVHQITLTKTRFSVRRRTIVALALTISVAALHAQAGDPPSRAARISALNGKASLQPAGATDWSEAALNYTVTTGDRIYTGAGSRLELEIGPMSVRLSDNSDVTVTNLTDGFMQLGLEEGTVRLSVYRLARGDSIEIDTPNGAVMVTTPGEYYIDIPDNNVFTVVSVDQGSVEVVGPGVDQIVRRGQTVQLSGTDNIRAISMPRPAQTDFDKWGSDRNTRVTSEGCARYMSRDIPGCADLDDNGRWESNAQYGAVWYPTHVSNDWVPYRDGRWVWIEPWGWSWVADEPWGYAPFHYGRWAQMGPRWGWIPGPIEVRPYYAPALVAFVGGSGWSVGVSVNTQAWFPLGPREAYIPSYHHDDVYLRQVNISNVRNVTNINTIINVQNVNQVNYVNRRVGMTAVSTDAFRSGRPTAKEIVTVAPENRGRGSIISHPSAAPDARAALGGRPAAAPPPAAPRPPMVTTASPRNAGRGGQARGEPQRGQPQQIPPQRGQPQQTPPPQAQPQAQPQTPPQRGQPQTPPPVGQPQTQPPGQRGQPQRNEPQRGEPQRGEPQRGNPAPVPSVATPTPPPSAATPPIAPQPRRTDVSPDRQRPGRPIITRTPPPPEAPPFQAKEPALQEHPGKALEPQQVQNLRGGRPAGPPKDPETADHRIVRPQPATPPAAAPTKQPTPPAPAPVAAPTKQPAPPPAAAPTKQPAPPTPAPPAGGRGRDNKSDPSGRGKPDAKPDSGGRGRPGKPIV
jgi:hypothetical protein